MAFHTFKMLCDHHLHLVPKKFLTLLHSKIPYPRSSFSHISPSSWPETTNTLSGSMQFPFPDVFVESFSIDCNVQPRLGSMKVGDPKPKMAQHSSSGSSWHKLLPWDRHCPKNFTDITSIHPPNNPQGTCCHCSYFTDKQTEAQRG